jgi:hypothetical protein
MGFLDLAPILGIRNALVRAAYLVAERGPDARSCWGTTTCAHGVRGHGPRGRRAGAVPHRPGELSRTDS